MSIEENGHTNGEMEEVSARHDSTAEQSFDELARGFSTGTVPRRKALRMLAASLFGGALVAAPAGMALAAPRDNRKPGGTGCPKAGQIRDSRGDCVCQSGLVTCGPSTNQSCVDPRTCPTSTGQQVNPDTCKCECINSNETLCPGTGQCVSNACPEGAVLETSGESCSCQCRNQGKVIVGTGENARCECTPVNCAGDDPENPRLEVQDPDTCACVCAPATVRCGGNCVAECLEGFVLKNCECVPEITCIDICEGCCDQGTCRGGGLDTACGAAGEACEDCTAAGNVCVNGDCVECATNAQCAAGQACVDNVCGACTTDAQCGTGQVCSSTGACVQCVTNAQCAAGQACVNNVCGACTTDAQCGTGFVCSSGVCVTAPTTGTCTTDANCGSGQKCCPAGTSKAGTCKGSGGFPGNCA